MAQNIEGKIQGDIVDAIMKLHRVAWCSVVSSGTHRMKWGALKVGYYNTGRERQVSGMSDIIGQLSDGRFFCIEVKEPGKEPSENQYTFLSLVIDNGGLSGWANSVKGALDILREVRNE